MTDKIKTLQKVRAVQSMGHMRTFGLLGFERWGGLRPAKMWTPDGRCFVPMFWGLWRRVRG